MLETLHKKSIQATTAETWNLEKIVIQIQYFICWHVTEIQIRTSNVIDSSWRTIRHVDLQFTVGYIAEFELRKNKLKPGDKNGLIKS